MSRGAARSGPLRTETGPLDLAMEALMWGTERADGTFRDQPERGHGLNGVSQVQR